MTRRHFIRSSAGLGLAAAMHQLLPAFALEPAVNAATWPAPSDEVDLAISWTPIDIGGRKARATTVNGTVPGPLVRLREGDNVTLRVTNHLQEDSSIHWHGLILPANMDGVPGLSYDGIQPGETYTYQFRVAQNGTYWYHSHSGLQEQTGVYGPLIIDAADPEPYQYDREYVVMLSDWTFEDPHRVMANLKKMGGYYNYQKRTMADFVRDASDTGWKPTMANRLMWSGMRMDPTDISDVTGHTYTYLMNGMAPQSNWTGLFKSGERVRLRFINGSAMTYFDIRIPGLKMTVVAADGQNVQPVEVDEFRISVAETFDVIVEPRSAQAYTVFAESMDRSGFARGTLAPRPGMSAPIPPRRKRPLLTMKDMGMDMSGMTHGNTMEDMSEPSHPMPAMDMTRTSGDTHSAHDGGGVMHGPDHHGPGNTAVAMTSKSRLHEPGVGLENTGTRVLVYTDLKGIKPGYDKRESGREIELHLTGNMERYMWSFDGEQFSHRTEPIRFVHGERVRLTFVNDTMMNHPIHLHGMWMELDNGNGDYNPRKHTVNVKPAERLSVDVTADAPGNWAFHCHLLFHMDMGMFRVVSVSKPVPK